MFRSASTSPLGVELRTFPRPRGDGYVLDRLLILMAPFK
jgi:hypothetical protein